MLVIQILLLFENNALLFHIRPTKQNRLESARNLHFKLTWASFLIYYYFVRKWFDHTPK